MSQVYEAPTLSMCSIQSQVSKLRVELHNLLQIMVQNQTIEDREAQLLSLRLGLLDGECVTLQRTGELLHVSPEWVRQRQYFLLKRKINDPHFLLKLKEYSHFVSLPKGIKIR